MNNEMQKMRLWNMGTALAAILILFLVVLSIKIIKETSYVGTDSPITNTITVTGTGDAVAKPDIATFSFSVTENAKDVATAQAAATTKSNAAIKALTDAGVSSDDIQTTSYSINPHYDYDQNGTLCAQSVTPGAVCRPGSSVLTGYDVSQTESVKIRDLTKAGTLFTTIGTLGVQNVDGLSFAVDKPDAVQDQARTTAINDAKSKADTLASELGVSLVRVVSFNEDSGNPVVYPYAMAADSMVKMGASPAATPPTISTGEQKITSNVTITYQIK